MSTQPPLTVSLGKTPLGWIVVSRRGPDGQVEMTTLGKLSRKAAMRAFADWRKTQGLNP